MKSTARLLAVLCVLVAVASLQPAHAKVGFGGYVSTEVGSTDWDADDPSGETVNGDTGQMGFGFVLDTCPGKEHVFNYRLNVGYETFKSDLDGGGEFKGTGFALDNTFGFAVFRNDRTRVWLGPQIKLSFYGGDDVVDKVARFGGGAVVGANFKVGERSTISVSGGFIWSGYGLTLNHVDVYEDLPDVTGTGGSFALQVAFLF
jgi:hypothetical protein